MNASELATKIDHTLLKVTASSGAIEKLGQECLLYGFASACVHPYWLPFLNSKLPSVTLCTVIGFPLGLQTVKIHEAQRSVEAGARELDIVVNHAEVMARQWSAIESELKVFRQMFPQCVLKLILETCRLSEDEIIQLSVLASDCGFDFVKTSTGFAESGASLKAVTLMRKHCHGSTQVKASGGIRTLAETLAMIDAGADRIGTSAGVDILKAMN